MADLGWPELLVLAVSAMLLFGWKRLPDASRSVGRSIRILRSELAGIRTDASTTASMPVPPSDERPADSRGD